MSDSETPTQPLIGASNQQTAINVGESAQGRGSYRAYKVAGLTLLACVLIMGQAAIAYFIFSQRSDIRNLQDQNNKMNTELTQGRPGSMPMQMHIPMNPMHTMMDDTMEEEASTSGKPAAPLTSCQQEAAGLTAGLVPGFYPRCDKNGLYELQQCFLSQCWCVNPVSGLQVPGSESEGQVICNGSAFPGSSLLLKDEVEIQTD